MHTDRDRCLSAVRGRDTRFDGWFYTAVRTTGIYCRPSCPAAPNADNVVFYPSAAAAQRAGFRPCKRCRPDASPGAPAWDHRTDVVARAMRLIADGAVDREGVAGVARRVGYSTRQLERHLLADLGAGPLALARAHRAQTARTLIETTALPVSEVAFAAGFGSIRSFNDTVRAVFGASPTELRRRASTRQDGAAPTAGGVSLRLPFRKPLTPTSLLGHLLAAAVPGVEEGRSGAYRRSLRLPHGHGIVELSPEADHVACRLRLTDLRDLTAAVDRCRRLLDLDADPVAVDEHLGGDRWLAALVASAAGRRVPRTVDAEELAVRAVLGQQVTTAAARTHAGRLAASHGTEIDDPAGGITHLFPRPAALAELDPATLALPRARGAALHRLVAALAEGRIELGPGADRAQARDHLRSLPGLGPWTVEVIAMRGLGDPDAFPVTDRGVRLAAERLGLPGTPAALSAHADGWRPWRAYAVQHLWAVLGHETNRRGPHLARRRAQRAAA